MIHVVGAGAEGAVDDGLPREASRVAARQRLEYVHSLRVLRQIFRVGAVERPSDSETRFRPVREPEFHRRHVGRRRTAVYEEVRPTVGVVAARHVGADLVCEIRPTTINMIIIM